MLCLHHPKITYNHILFIWVSWLQNHATLLLQKTWNVLGSKNYNDAKISHFPHSIHHFKGNIKLFHKHMPQVHFQKLLLNKFTTGISKKSTPPPSKIPENSKNILGAGGWHKPNIFLITALLSDLLQSFWSVCNLGRLSDKGRNTCLDHLFILYFRFWSV